MGFFVATLSPNNSNASRNRLVPGSACVSSGSPPPVPSYLGVVHLREPMASRDPPSKPVLLEGSRVLRRIVRRIPLGVLID